MLIKNVLNIKLNLQLHGIGIVISYYLQIITSFLINMLEAKFIEEVVKDIYHRVHIPLRSSLSFLIGMNDSIKFITSSLKDNSSHTGDILTILVMGGIWKSSLAKYVYRSPFCEFNTSYTGDISRRCVDKFNGLLDLQKKLCGDIKKTSLIQVHDGSIYTSRIV
uniref:Uncharacterized protein n=1 Tax=Lactuca sativa TaxID=4236 RepID=A0A9R1V7P4_LACSA|nr:hypothetical protein LSAT_V11C600318490 [Lactuca sativa]